MRDCHSIPADGVSLENPAVPKFSMSYIMVDVEADGPMAGDYSMVCFGAVVMEAGLNRTFYRKLRSTSNGFILEAEGVMRSFSDWLAAVSDGRPMFISDNNGFDWQFINYYFHHFTGPDPFGFSSTNLGSLYKTLLNQVHRIKSCVYHSVSICGTGKLRILATLLVPRDSTSRPGFPQIFETEIARLLAFHLEDMKACTAVQRGLPSRTYPLGCFSHLEMPIWLFHRYLQGSYTRESSCSR